MSQPNRESVKAVKCATFDDIIAHGPGGYKIINQGAGHSLIFILPGENDLRSITISKRDHGQSIWQWNGNEDSPTLTPSILAYDRHNQEKVEIWHGYLTNGIFQSI